MFRPRRVCRETAEARPDVIPHKDILTDIATPGVAFESHRTGRVVRPFSPSFGARRRKRAEAIRCGLPLLSRTGTPEQTKKTRAKRIRSPRRRTEAAIAKDRRGSKPFVRILPGAESPDIKKNSEGPVPPTTSEGRKPRADRPEPGKITRTAGGGRGFTGRFSYRSVTEEAISGGPSRYFLHIRFCRFHRAMTESSYRCAFRMKDAGL